jgi:hypothetical protein
MPRRNDTHKKPPTGVALVPQDKFLVSRKEAACLLSISERAMDYLVATKQISSRRIGSRVLVPVAEIRRFSLSDHPERLAG